jgi:hypothetical protein
VQLDKKSDVAEGCHVIVAEKTDVRFKVRCNLVLSLSLQEETSTSVKTIKDDILKTVAAAFAPTCESKDLTLKTEAKKFKDKETLKGLNLADDDELLLDGLTVEVKMTTAGEYSFCKTKYGILDNSFHLKPYFSATYQARRSVNSGKNLKRRKKTSLLLVSLLFLFFFSAR